MSIPSLPLRVLTPLFGQRFPRDAVFGENHLFITYRQDFRTIAEGVWFVISLEKTIRQDVECLINFKEVEDR